MIESNLKAKLKTSVRHSACSCSVHISNALIILHWLRSRIAYLRVDVQSSARYCATLIRATHSRCRCARSARSLLYRHQPSGRAACQALNRGSRTFPVAASQIWNALPEDVTSAQLCGRFSSDWRLFCSSCPSLFSTLIVDLAVTSSLRPLSKS